MKKIILFIQRSFSVVGVFAILFAAGFTSSRAQDAWIKKSNLNGSYRHDAVGFSIGNKGYIGTGFVLFFYPLNDFWEYDPATDVWTQKADFGGSPRSGGVGFSIGSKGYIGAGADYNGDVADFWEYDPANNTWLQRANCGGGSRFWGVGFSIGSKGYIGTGSGNDFWEYDPIADVWIQKANFGGTGRYGAVGFSIGSKGYIGSGSGGNDFWEYDPATDMWTQKAEIGGPERTNAVGFSIGTKGYIGTGEADNDDLRKDFWEYEPATDTWTQRADFGGIGRSRAVGFSIDSKGYIGTGSDKKDFWEYTPDNAACTFPSNLKTKKITSSSAQLSWDLVAGAQKYKVRYKVSGTNDWTTSTNISSVSKKISGLASNTSYTCEVKSVCSANPIVSSEWSSSQTFTTGSERIGDESLQQISFQIYPNPAKDHVTIKFILSHSSHANIKVYDASGKEIELLLDENLEQGDHSLQLNINHFSKGIYVVKMISDFGIENQKLIVQ